jgi:3D (Asp-Asp-Asp) domain-containing protein
MALALFMVGVPLTVMYGLYWSICELPRTKDTRTSRIFNPQEVQPPDAPPEHVLATAYCGCPLCCGKWSSPEAVTASGISAEEGVTIAADWSVFPRGACIAIAGIGKRIVQDTGSAIKGARLDVFFASHEEALEFGARKLSVKPC